MNEFEAGAQVRLKSDPGKIGTLSGRTRDRLGEKVHFVQFPGRPSWHDQSSLELCESELIDYFSMLQKKQFGRTNDFRRNLTHIQLSGRLANLVYSMDTTNTEFYAYQYKPVLCFLDSPSKGILIADEVGLGKTIEAGLIWTELRARYDARRLLIVCPAVLREKWKDELAVRFGVEASLINAEELYKELNRSRQAYPPGRAIICSYDGIRPPKNTDVDSAQSSSGSEKLAKLLKEKAFEDPLFDLVIFDEAHKMRNPESATSKLGRLLRDASEHLLLLSATPINLKNEDLYYLLNIADEDTFSNEYLFPSVLEANEPLIKAQKAVLDKRNNWLQVKAILQGAQFNPLLSENEQLGNLIELDEDFFLNTDTQRVEIANRIEKCNLLSKVVTRTRKRDVKELRVIREAIAPHINMTVAERDLYERVTDVVRNYAEYMDVSEGFLLATPQRQLSSCMYAAVRAWRKRAGFILDTVYEDFGIDAKLADDSPLMYEIADQVLGEIDAEELRRHDSKFNELKTVLNNYFEEFTNEKVIIFSFFRGTLAYLSERLKEIGISNEVLVGGMREPKQEILNRFKNSDACKVLLASEVASEGVDLQFCKILINYDLPWNPMKIEQRIGRIDRHGQLADKIKIFNFCYYDTIDQRIYERLFERLDIFQRALGDMEAILGQEITNLTKELFSYQLTKEEENTRIEQTSLAIERLRVEEATLEEQASSLIAHSGHILQAVNAAHEFSKRISERDLSIYVQDYLEKQASAYEFFKTSEDKEFYSIKLPPDLSAKLSAFIKERNLHGLTTLHDGHKVECKFLNSMVADGGKKELINQTHPLIQFISHETEQLNELYVPLVSLKLPSKLSAGLKSDIYAGSIERWSFKGLRVEEMLKARFVKLSDNTILETEESIDLANRLRLSALDWPEASIELDTENISAAFDICDKQLQLDFDKELAFKRAENRDRVSLQKASAKKHFERELSSAQNALNTLIINQRKGLIAATEGRIKKIKERFDIKSDELNRMTELNGSPDDVCHVVLNVS